MAEAGGAPSPDDDGRSSSSTTALLSSPAVGRSDGDNSAAAPGRRTLGFSHAEGASPAQKPARLPHLTGVRTMVALWIVCHHMAPMRPASGISVFTMRVDVAVELFMMLSGFVYQYNYGDKDIAGSTGQLAKFYVTRLTRILLTTQVSMLLCLFFWGFGSFFGNGKSIMNLDNLGCLLFVRAWVNPDPSCPNAPTWFITACLPSWLLYPLLTQRVLRAVTSGAGLLLLCVAFWLAAIAPQLLLLLLQESWLSWDQVKLTWFWPPAQLADFALGCALAALLRRAPPSAAASRLADLALAAVLLVCLLAPVVDTPDDWTGPVFRPGHYMAWDALSGRLAAPLLAAWIYFGAAAESCALSVRCLSHPVLVGLGAYTLEVYLLQTPLHDAFTWTKDALQLTPESTEVFVFYMLLLWFLSALLVDTVSTPADKWLRAAAERRWGSETGEAKGP
eukprot:TRINITY_DN14845_c0_g2_i1.p1 TRINITY_DN14845_c0_g2~~TRINITY_DN14845_c0_g2_i1.p1  ORF type:complete len:476 (-),score=103.56 TRINITY_DN14845_c0_g2_i1:3-1346(-)